MVKASVENELQMVNSDFKSSFANPLCARAVKSMIVSSEEAIKGLRPLSTAKDGG